MSADGTGARPLGPAAVPIHPVAFALVRARKSVPEQFAVEF
jgi:hypothetical protein